MDSGIIQQLVQQLPGDFAEVMLFESRLDLVAQKRCISKLENFTLGMSESFQINVDGDDTRGRSSSTWNFNLISSGGNLTLKYNRSIGRNHNHSDEDKIIWHYVEASILEPNGMKMGRTSRSSLCTFISDYQNEVFQIDTRSLDLPFLPTGDRCLVLEATLKIFRRTPTVNTKLDRNGNDNDASAGLGFAWTMTNKPKPKTNYGAFLNSKDHSDVKIFSSDGQEFHAHKIVLRAGSEVFDAMLKSEMTESTTGIIKLDDMSAAAVTFLLNYLYCGEMLSCTVNGKKLECALFQASGVKTPSKDSKEKETLVTVTAEEALYVASKYRLDELRDFMDHSFRRFCNEENAISLLEMSKLYSLNCKEFLKNFIKNHPRTLDKVLEHQC